MGNLGEVAFTFPFWFNHAQNLPQSNRERKSKTKVAHYPKLTLKGFELFVLMFAMSPANAVNDEGTPVNCPEVIESPKPKTLIGALFVWNLCTSGFARLVFNGDGTGIAASASPWTETLVSAMLNGGAGGGTGVNWADECPANKTSMMKRNNSLVFIIKQKGQSQVFYSSLNSFCSSGSNFIFDAQGAQHCNGLIRFPLCVNTQD